MNLEPNFYYPQEDFLSRFCSSHSTSYTICMPSFICGAVPDAAMNFVFPLGVYASVVRHLGQKLEFPSDLTSWENSMVGSSSMLNGYMEEWAVFQEGASGEKFNTTDGSPFTWGGFWPKFARWYGVEAGRPDLDDSVYRKVTTRYDPPPRGYVCLSSRPHPLLKFPSSRSLTPKPLSSILQHKHPTTNLIPAGDPPKPCALDSP